MVMSRYANDRGRRAQLDNAARGSRRIDEMFRRPQGQATKGAYPSVGLNHSEDGDEVAITRLGATDSHQGNTVSTYRHEGLDSELG